MRTSTLSLLLAVCLVCALIHEARANDASLALTPSSDAEVTYKAGLDGLFASWPLLKPVRGLALVRLSARLEAGKVIRTIQVAADQAWFGPLPLGTFLLNYDVPERPGPAPATLRISGPAGTLEASLHLALALDRASGAFLPPSGAATATLTWANLDLGQLTLAWPLLALAGKAQLTASLGGTFEQPELSLTLAAEDTAWRGERVGRTRVAWLLKAHRSSLVASFGQETNPLLTADVTWPLQVNLASAQAAWLDAQEHSVKLEAHNLTPDRIRPFVSAPSGAQFDLGLLLEGSGTLDQFWMQGKLTGWFGAVDGKQLPFDSMLEAGPSQQSVSLKLGEGLVAANWQFGVDLPALRRSGKPMALASVSGAAELQTPLVIAGPYLPSIVAQPEGVLSAALQFSGTLGAPAIQGSVSVSQGAVTLVPMRRRLESLTLVAQFQGQKLRLDQLSGISSPGNVLASGEADWNLTPAGSPAEDGLWAHWTAHATCKLALEQFPLVQEGIPVSLVQGGADVTLEAAPNNLQVAITLGATDVKLTSENLPEASEIPSDDAVRILDWLGTIRHTGPVAQDRFRLDLSLPQPLHLHGPEADVSLAGRLLLDRQGQVVHVDGGLDVAPGGTISLFHNRFTLQGGYFSLAEGHLGRPAAGIPTAEEALSTLDAAPEAAPLEPILHLAARASVLDTHVLLRLVGPARRPQLVLLAVPTLPEYQILTLLIMGRVDAEDHRDGEVRRVAAALVNKFHNPGLKKQLFDQIGVDKLGLGFGSSVSQPIVTVGKQVTRTLYLETVYRHNSPPDANRREGRVQYQLASNWTVDTRFGDAAEGGFGLFWAFSFGGPEPPPPPGDEWGHVPKPVRKDSDGDGIMDPHDLCIQDAEDPDQYADDDGCPDPDNDLDGVPDGVDAAPNLAETANGFEDEDGKPDVAPLRLQQITASLRTFSFDANSDKLPEAGRAALDSAASLLGMFDGLRVELTGHSDDLGTPQRNNAVSLQRARTARTYLTRRGVAGGRITVVGQGSTQPLDPAPTPEARARNRRVEIRVFYPQP